MVDWIYQGIVLGVSAWSIFRGFRRGIWGNLSSVLGLAFGVVFARVLTPEYSYHFQGIAKWLAPEVDSSFVADQICADIVYIAVFFLFDLFTGVLRGALSVFELGILNRLGGVFFCMLKNLTWISMAFNLMLCMNPENRLMDYERAADGNIVASVMSLFPALSGCNGAEDLSHLMQLKEAAKISCNFKGSTSVIT